MLADLLHRKQSHFVLWRPGTTEPRPSLYIGTFNPQKSQVLLENVQEIFLEPSSPDLWEKAASECNLSEGTVYWYWFKVSNTDPYDAANRHQVMYCTDPIAYTVDRRIFAPVPSEAGGTVSGDPASVILYRDGKLIPCDPDGQTVDWEEDNPSLSPNNKLVIYELPTRWTKINRNGNLEQGNGTFRDVQALLIAQEIAPSFPYLMACNNRAHLEELGINALELLPPEDSDDQLKWGYGTANYFAADYDLGLPDSQKYPTASTDLVNLIKVCHEKGLRFFLDAVMAFSRNNPYHNINFSDFYVKWGSGDPEQGNRDGFGGDLFKYNYRVDGYNPTTGKQENYVPAREYMKLHVAHWLMYYRVDGLRLDSVNNTGSYDFLQEFKDYARSLWTEQGGSGDRFLVVGEELSVPIDLVKQNRLDGLWNERFKQILRQVILGKNAWDEPSFEWSIRKLIDCRNLGFNDNSQAINYLTSHDIGGIGNERFFNYLVNNGINHTEPRIKLAFVCLLTAVGIPMILAGDEFADQQDFIDSNEHSDSKQIDPVNYSRLNEDWRSRIFQYVARLVRFRTSSPALEVNNTQFIHADFNDGKRVIVWQRGVGDNLVVVVANFSDYGTSPNSEYKIPNFPPTPANKQWEEITQERIVPSEWVGREGIYPWEAKVYALR